MLADRADHIWPTVVRLTHSIFVHARCTVGWISATFRDLRHCSSHVELQRDRTHFLEYNVQCAIYIYAYQLWVKRFSFTPILINLFPCSFPFSRNWGSTSHPHGISMGPTGPMGIPNVDSYLLRVTTIPAMVVQEQKICLVHRGFYPYSRGKIDYIFHYTFNTAFAHELAFCFYKLKIFVHFNGSIGGDWWLYPPKTIFPHNHSQARQSSVFFGGKVGLFLTARSNQIG